MADEEIVLGGDTSGLVRALNQGRVSFEQMTQAAGLNDAQMKKVGASLERVIGQIAAASVKNAAATQASTASSKAATASMTSQATAAQKLATEEKRVFDALGLVRNANNSISNAKNGQFANRETIELAKSYVRSLEEITRAEEAAAAANRARAASAGRANAAQNTGPMQANTTGPVGSAAWLSSQNTQALAQFSKVQAAVVGQIPQMMTLRSLLSQIPPATWAVRLGAASDQLLNMSNSARYALYSVSAGAAVAGAAIGGFGAISINAAVSHERAFANVQRTTQATAAGYEVLRKQLQGMAMELPVTYDEITKIATAAGQLGIQTTGVASFTKVVAQLTATTNLTSDAAGNALARFKSFFSSAADPSLAVTERTFSNLASSILKVGVNSIATEQGIVNVSTQISSMGKYAGFTADQVIGLAGALSSVGVAPELSRGITTRFFTLIGNAVSDGGIQLEKFAALSGHSASEFEQAWGTEKFAGIFTDLLQGLNGVASGGGDANQALVDLGVEGSRDRPVLLRLATAADTAGTAGALLAENLNNARQGWRDNAELALQYTKISQTAAARIQVMAQSFEQLFASMGAESGNFVGEIAKNVTGLLRVLDEFAQSDFGKVLGTFVVQGSLVVGAILLVIGALAGLAATAQGVGQAFREMTAAGVGGATALSRAFRLVTLASGFIGLVATLATTVGMFLAMSDAAAKATVPVQDIQGLLNAMKTDAENGAEGMRFYGEKTGEAGDQTDRLKETSDNMADALDGVTGSSKNAAGGMDGLKNATKGAVYVMGPAAKEFFKSALLIDEGFQKLFAGDNNGRKLADKFDINLGALDWDAIINESLTKNGDVSKIVEDQINDLLPKGQKIKDLGLVGGSFQEYAAEVEDALTGVRPEIQNQIAAQNALADNTQHGVAEMIDDYELLEDAQKKTVDNMAAGLTAFASSSTLIGLTQKMNEIFAGPDTDEQGNAIDKAAQWEQAWTDAYGGASFSIDSYMNVFRRASGEQSTFVQQLQQLSVRGLSTSIIEELSAMGPEAASLVEALYNGTDAQLQEYESLWGTTGYDSMIKFATQAAIGNEIVKAVMAVNGLESLQAFNASLASGVGVEEALAALQLDMNGQPLTPKTAQPSPIDPFDRAKFSRENALSVPVTPYLTKSRIVVDAVTGGGSFGMYAVASGGHITGPGTGTSDSIPAWLSNGEFVMNAAATRNIGVDNLYSMMRQAQGGRSAPRGRGYAKGGVVGGSGAGSMGGSIVHFSPEDRQLLMDIRDRVGITITEASVTATANAGNANSAKRRAA